MRNINMIVSQKYCHEIYIFVDPLHSLVQLLLQLEVIGRVDITVKETNRVGLLYYQK